MIESTQRAGGREAPLEELRHREDLRPDVERHEHPAQHQQAPGVQLVVGHGHAARCARAGQADQVLRADVRREDRRADDEPAEVAAGQEVVVGGVLVPPDEPEHHAGEEREVREDDQPVECGHGRFNPLAAESTTSGAWSKGSGQGTRGEGRRAELAAPKLGKPTQRRRDRHASKPAGTKAAGGGMPGPSARADAVGEEGDAQGVRVGAVVGEQRLVVAVDEEAVGVHADQRGGEMSA